MLPQVTLEVGRYSVFGASQPLREIGGDYFDFLAYGKEQLAVCVADVMGKGIPAALLMTNLQAAVRGLGMAGQSPASLTAQLNEQLCGNLSGGKFVTLFYGLVDAASRRMCYTNAGHNAPILIRAQGKVERLKVGGGVLGIFRAADYAQDEIALAPGDMLALFTDGLTEVCNPQGDDLGEARLIELLRSQRGNSAVQSQRAVFDGVRLFSGNQFQDDATLVILQAN